MNQPNEYDDELIVLQFLLTGVQFYQQVIQHSNTTLHDSIIHIHIFIIYCRDN